jgi:endosialidase-like protein
MLRRDFPRAMLASAAGMALTPVRAEAHPQNAPPVERTAAEVTAGVTPADPRYPPLHVLRYGVNASPGSTDMTDAIRAALSVAAVGGGTVFAPAQSYRVSGPLVVPPGVALCGDGPEATTLEHHIDAPGAVGVTLGNSDTGLSGGCALRNLCIRMHIGNTTAVMLRSTIGASVENVQLLGDGHTFSFTGCVIRGGASVGCFFNVLQNVYAEHFHVGFQFTDLGTMATNQTLINCSAFGDYSYGDKTSVGVQFAAVAAPNSGFSGESSLWLGGNMENCGTGVSFSSRTEYTQWFGTRFEANRVDVDFGTNTTRTARNAFYGPANSFNFTGSLRPDNAYYLGPDCSGVHISRGAGALGTNIAIGTSALTLGSVTTGSDNVALGVGALAAQRVGDHCVAVGNAALAAAGGSQNTALGYNAQCGPSGDGNIAVGFNAGTLSSPRTLSGSHQAVFGDSRLTNAYIQVPWTTVADRRDTTDVTPLERCLQVVCALQPVSFRIDDRSTRRNAGLKTPETHAGLIAQDVARALREHGFDPSLVVDTSDPDKLGLTHERLIPFLIGAISDLSSQLQTLTAEPKK